MLKDPSFVYRLDHQIQVLVDASGALSFDDIVKPRTQALFKPNHGNLTFGYLKSPIWLKVQTRSSPGTRWLLEIPAPFLEYVDFYQRESTGWHHYRSGYYRKQSEREFSHTGHVVPLNFQSDSLSTVYIRIGGVSPKTFPVYAMQESKFIEKNRFEDLGYGIFFGVLAVMFFYNFFIYVILRQQNYLYYFVTIVLTFLLFSAISGYGGKFLWRETPQMNYFAGKLTLELLVIFLSVFTIRFLEVKRYSLAMYYALWLLIILAVLAFVMVTTNTFPFAGNTLISFSSVVFIATGIVVRIKGNKTANYFIAAWTLYFAGGLLISLRNSGILDYGFWTTHVVEIGAVLETAIIGFALGHQYRRYKKEKEDAQMHALKIQEDAMAWLESKVKERTGELTKAYEQLQQTLETNEKQTLVIREKNAELDALFYRISHDLKGPISSALGLVLVAKLETKDAHALDSFDRLQLQLERLSNLIAGLSRLARFNEELRIQRIDFDKIIDECLDSFRLQPNFSKIEFRKDIQSGLDFYSEWTLLTGILQNLIENSIKYAREESPYVRISARQEADMVVLQVEDNGNGIPAEHLSRIFDMFYRVSENEDGSGLGLYILKRCVDRLKGTVEVVSDEDVGSAFTVRLPSLDKPIEG